MNTPQCYVVRILPVLLERVTIVTIYCISRVFFVMKSVDVYGEAELKFRLILFFQGPNTNHWSEILVRVGNIISANAVQHLELRIIGRNRKGTHRSNLEVTWRRFFYFL